MSGERPFHNSELPVHLDGIALDLDKRLGGVKELQVHIAHERVVP